MHAREEAHASFDRLWKKGLGVKQDQQGVFWRSTCYQWLAAKLGLGDTCHIGDMTADQCRSVVDTCRGVLRHHIAEWVEKRDRDARSAAYLRENQGAKC